MKKGFYKDWNKEDIKEFFLNTPEALSLIIPNGDGTNTVIERNDGKAN